MPSPWMRYPAASSAALATTGRPLLPPRFSARATDAIYSETTAGTIDCGCDRGPRADIRGRGACFLLERLGRRISTWKVGGRSARQLPLGRPDSGNGRPAPDLDYKQQVRRRAAN